MADLKLYIGIDFSLFTFFFRRRWTIKYLISHHSKDRRWNNVGIFCSKKLLASIESLLLLLFVCFSSAPLIRFARRSKVHGSGGGKGRTKKETSKGEGGWAWHSTNCITEELQILGLLFHVLMLCLPKSPKNYYGYFSRLKSVWHLDINLQNYFVYGCWRQHHFCI